MQPRWFTPESALAALASLREPAEAIASAWRHLESASPGPVYGDTPVNPRYFTLSATLRAALDRVARCGVRLGDARRGSLEFPARRAGRPVLLCWSPGDPAPAWRPVDGDAKQPLDEGPWDPFPPT